MPKLGTPIFLRFLKLTLLLFLFSACTRKYKRTVKVCDESLYVEIYNINPAGVDADYLTDSINFRICVGQFDNEHENITYNCNGDTVVIHKFERTYSVKDDRHDRRTIFIRKFSISQLKKDGSFD